MAYVLWLCTLINTVQQKPKWKHIFLKPSVLTDICNNKEKKGFKCCYAVLNLKGISYWSFPLFREAQFVSLGNNLAAMFVAVLFMSFGESGYSWLTYIWIFIKQNLVHAGKCWVALWWMQVVFDCTLYDSLQGETIPLVACLLIWGKLYVICSKTILQRLSHKAAGL